MKPFKILVKNLDEFIKEQRMLYASGDGKQFFVLLRSGPNVKRYVIESYGKTMGFTKKSDAVRYFNNS